MRLDCLLSLRQCSLLQYLGAHQTLVAKGSEVVVDCIEKLKVWTKKNREHFFLRLQILKFKEKSLP